MEKYSRAVSEMYLQFKEVGPHRVEKYIGRHVVFRGRTREVVGYISWSDGSFGLIVDASGDEGWSVLCDQDVIFKKCNYYLYVSINNLID